MTSLEKVEYFERGEHLTGAKWKLLPWMKHAHLWVTEFHSPSLLTQLLCSRHCLCLPSPQVLSLWPLVNIIIVVAQHFAEISLFLGFLLIYTFYCGKNYRKNNRKPLRQAQQAAFQRLS